MKDENTPLLVGTVDGDAGAQKSSSPNRWDLFICYIFQVAFSKLFMGSTFWQLSASILDNINGPNPSFGYYMFRNFMVGIWDATFCCLGCVGSTYAVSKAWTREDESDTFKLWVAAFFNGFLWQVETDVACFLADLPQGWVYDASSFTGVALIINFVIYATVHTFIFYVGSRAMKAPWAEFIIDLQVGLSGFGFYFAGMFITTDTPTVLVAINAGFWTFVFGTIPGFYAIFFPGRKIRTT